MRRINIPEPANTGSHGDYYPVGVTFHEETPQTDPPTARFPAGRFNPGQAAFASDNVSFADFWKFKVYMYKVRMPDGRRVNISVGMTCHAQESAFNEYLKYQMDKGKYEELMTRDDSHFFSRERLRAFFVEAHSPVPVDNSQVFFVQ